MLKKNKFTFGGKKCNTKQYDTAIPISWGLILGHTQTWHGQQVTSVIPNRGVRLLFRLYHFTHYRGCQLLGSNFQSDLQLTGIFLQRLTKVQLKTSLKNDHQHHTVPHSSLLHHVNNQFRRYWVSSGRCKNHSIIKMLKKNKFTTGCKKICNIKQYDTAIPTYHTAILWLFVRAICVCP